MGLNLQKANKIIYFSLTDRSELFEQSKKRIHRIGQEKRCFYYLMLCPGTVEEDILHTLELRRDYTDELFKSIKKTSIAKRILISWLIVAIIFSLVGFLIGSITSHGSDKATEPEAETETEILIYGQYDGRIFNGEMSMDWGGDLNFVPLDVPMDEDLQEFIFYLSAGYNIDFTLVMAMIQQESGFQADVISGSNDYGLMQINKINHPYITETLGITDFLEPYNNVRSGMFILRKLFEKYETPEKALMAYNMGETGASRLWEQGIFETNYSKKVLQYQQQFIEELERSSNND